MNVHGLAHNRYIFPQHSYSFSRRNPPNKLLTKRSANSAPFCKVNDRFYLSHRISFRTIIIHCFIWLAWVVIPVTYAVRVLIVIPLIGRAIHILFICIVHVVFTACSIRFLLFLWLLSRCSPKSTA
jgi:hypothetical protein